MPRPTHVAEQIAADIIVSGQVRMNVWELLCDCLPTGELRREASTERSSSMSFCSGAYSQGPLFGLRRKTTLFPWATLLICKYIRSYTHVPFSSFVLQRNITMRAHKDLNNAPDSFNVLLPCSTFRGGGLWLQAPTGDCPSMDDALRGHRITVAVYAIKAVKMLDLDDSETLKRLQFVQPAIGFAIIFYTLLIKLLTFPLNQTSLRSSAIMQLIRPKVEQIQRKYKSDQETQNRMLLRLYDDCGVNPLGGCIPSVVQEATEDDDVVSNDLLEDPLQPLHMLLQNYLKALANLDYQMRHYPTALVNFDRTIRHYPYTNGKVPNSLNSSETVPALLKVARRCTSRDETTQANSLWDSSPELDNNPETWDGIGACEKCTDPEPPPTTAKACMEQPAASGTDPEQPVKDEVDFSGDGSPAPPGNAEACDNDAALPVLPQPETAASETLADTPGAEPDHPTSPYSEESDGDNTGVNPPSPTGPPPSLSAQQRARLHALLQQRDEWGRAPYNLDAYSTDQEKWQADRQAMREGYRQHRKRERAQGTWAEDRYDYRTGQRRGTVPANSRGADWRAGKGGNPLAHNPAERKEEALAVLTVVTDTNHSAELEQAESDVGDMLPRLRNLLDEATTGVGVLVGIYPHRGEAERIHPSDVIAQQRGEPDLPSQRRDRDPPDAVHIYKTQRAPRRLQPFLEGEMQVLGGQALAHLGEWIRAHWGEEVQLLSSDEEKEGNIPKQAKAAPQPQPQTVPAGNTGGTEAVETQQGETPQPTWGDALATLPDADSGAASSTTPFARPIPIFIGLYRSILKLAEINPKFKEPFLWIPSLAGPVTGSPSLEWLTTSQSQTEYIPNLGWEETGRYLILPLTLIASQVITQRISNPEVGNQGGPAGIVNAVIPLVIGYTSLVSPQGLGIYWLCNNLVTNGQTFFIKNQLGEEFPEYRKYLDGTLQTEEEERKKAKEMKAQDEEESFKGAGVGFAKVPASMMVEEKEVEKVVPAKVADAPKAPGTPGKRRLSQGSKRRRGSRRR
ncbi:ALB3.2 [Symbiodinium microadriaticum]|nr:ALB3.2 [Symbiodinium microadriaticum]